MFFERTINSRYYNFIAHHNYVSSLKKMEKDIQGRVLDVGCGLKPYEKIILKNIENEKDYIGCDYLNSIHSLHKVNIIANATSLPFKNESLNTILSFQVIEHIEEPELFFQEAHRILKNGGKAIITTPFLWGEHEIPRDFYRFTRYGLKYLANKNGFTVKRIEPDSGFWVTIVLRLNYSIKRVLDRKFIRYFFIPFFIFAQIIAYFLDKIDRNYTIDTIGFTSLLEKNTNH